MFRGVRGSPEVEESEGEVWGVGGLAGGGRRAWRKAASSGLGSSGLVELGWGVVSEGVLGGGSFIECGGGTEAADQTRSWSGAAEPEEASEEFHSHPMTNSMDILG